MTPKRSKVIVIGALGAAVLAAAIVAALVINQPGAEPTEPTPTPTPVETPDPVPDVEAAFAELLASCTLPVSEAPTGCGIQIPWHADLSSVAEITFEMEQAPTLEVDGDIFTATGGILVATVTGVASDGSAQTFTYRTENWTLRGSATETDEGYELDPWG